MDNASLTFYKYVGCGNDFLIFDHRRGVFPVGLSNLVKNLCNRRSGIGADGILLLENSRQADAYMRIFNSDGSEAEMCGNGLRCFVQWLYHLQLISSRCVIETVNGSLSASVHQEEIVIEMSAPKEISWHQQVKLDEQIFSGHLINSGVPHLVIFVKDIHQVDVAKWGKLMRFHSAWQPKGVNVNFVQQLSASQIILRTYERGVEGETLACGTGATAAALATAYLTNASSPITVQTWSKENLTIHFHLKRDGFSQVKMVGPAKQVFRGNITLSHFL